MFNKHKYKFISLALLVVLAGVALPIHFAHAGLSDLLGIGNIPSAVILFVISVGMTVVFHVVGFLLTMAGGLLNISINLTLHIKDFVQNTAGVYLVWQTIRDVSGMLIIFLLLYTSFRTILGIDQGINKLIKDIIIAGILINFSFFLVGVMIDASNMISLSVFNAIAPAQGTTCNVGSGNFSSCSVSSMLDSSTYDGGLSSIIMQNLKITGLFSAKWMSLDVVNMSATQFKILFIQIIGILVMGGLAISFIVAAIAFVVRLVMLIFILAFSPVWFASWIFPDMKPLSDKFSSALKGQLVFMPVYLFLLYAAIKILETMKLGSSATSIDTSSAAVAAKGALSLLINSTFVIAMINLPLMGAISVAGLTNSWFDKMTSSIKNKTTSFIGRNTLGRAAAKFENSKFMRDQYNNGNPLVSRALSLGLSKTRTAGFGGGKGSGFDDVRKKKVEAYTKIAQKGDLNDEEKDAIKKNTENSADYKENQAKIAALKSGRVQELQDKKKVLREEMEILAKSLGSTKAGSAEQKNIATKIEANKEQSKNVREELSEHTDAIKSHEEANTTLVKKAQDERKSALVMKWKAKGGVYKEAAKKYGKDETTADKINKALREEAQKIAASTPPTTPPAAS
ncbi:MAG: hypothetical protein WCO48_00525 [Candidatus Taylorbacteria bacterium]